MPTLGAMRILHTSDWHIGRTFHQHPTLEALDQVVEALAATVRERSVDVVLVAGDVFDSELEKELGDLRLIGKNETDIVLADVRS